MLKKSSYTRLKDKLAQARRLWEFEKQKQQARGQSNDPVLLDVIYATYRQHPEERVTILDDIVSENFWKNPAFLNPDLLEQLVPLDPETAIQFVKDKHDRVAQIETPFSTGVARKIISQAFAVKPETINQKSFNLVASLFQNNLRSLDYDETMLENLCLQHPELAKNNKYFENVDFVQRKQERDMIRDASIKESSLDLYGSKEYRSKGIPRPKR